MKRRFIDPARIYKVVSHPSDHLFTAGHPLNNAKIQLHQVGWQSLGVKCRQRPDGSLIWFAFEVRVEVLSGAWKGRTVSLPRGVRLNVIKTRPKVCTCAALSYPHRANSVPECKGEAE